MGSSGKLRGRPGRRFSAGAVLVFGCFAIYVTRDYRPRADKAKIDSDFLHFVVDIIIPRDDKAEINRSVNRI